ncbi:MAG: hypothetical protein Q8N54_11530 [Sulfurimicrobium sp.]|jgi:hypothetical protein|uniref:Transmembrane protein n=1 Tax=Gallionella capsiferriformans (strain ES-2) TaxID=395494 RepID=D9SEA5_GALCS|nr:hypothetical protein [Gallionella capsiferriformans]MDO8890388.1 hypothetical protein [Sulfurimicrobium sp.]ADL54881.1 hypothetical protein Galf_0845 [Gallionella capsiferriformans ES-2]MDP1703569.1 hypothetical protein [Sulfurimicrobium sp.]MDP2197748.1 hypothetical protein [Sulfurimicrobium sp.]MDP2963380.1 hypothetical protein [Sulfurimicrobium sp.]
MTTSLWRQHVLPFTLLVGLLAAATLAGDYLLHRLNLVWVGRYLGIPGTLLIIASLIYSLRKRKHIKSGNLKTLLTLHEFGTWIGASLVLIHAGIHFNAILPWLATVAMGVNAVSGMVGKLLLDRSRRHVQDQREHFQQRGLSRQDMEQAMFWDALMIDAMAKWRKVHIPIFIVFSVLALGHIISIFLFWGWI